MRRLASVSSGFTLLELLVAISLMAALTTSLYASFQIAFKSRARSEAAMGPARTGVLTLDLIRADLESALPPRGILAGAFNGQDTKGDGGKDSDGLVFFSCGNAPDGTTTACDVRRVEYALVVQPGDTAGVLVRRVTTNLLSPEVLTPTEETLCQRVLSFNLRYFDGSAWQDTWDSTQQGNAVPRAVEVTLELQRPAVTAGQVSANSYLITRIFQLPCGPSALPTGVVQGTP